MYKIFIFISLILAELMKNGVNGDGFCEISLKSMAVVSSCPSTQEEMKKASRRKNCSQYINKDAESNCSDYMRIKYHCVINDSGNQMIEVCAPNRKVNGFCTEFSEKQGRVQGHNYLECTGNNYKPQCPGSYDSSTSYLYRDCYNLTTNVKLIDDIKRGPPTSVTDQPTVTSKAVTERSTVTSKTTPTAGVLYWIIVPSLAVVIIIFIFIVSIIYRRRRRNANRTSSQDECENIPLNVQGGEDPHVKTYEWENISLNVQGSEDPHVKTHECENISLNVQGGEDPHVKTHEELHLLTNVQDREDRRIKRLLGEYDVWRTSISGRFSDLSDDEVCVLFCFLCSDSGTPDFTDTDCLDILNEIRGVVYNYNKDRLKSVEDHEKRMDFVTSEEDSVTSEEYSVTSEEAQRTLDKLMSRDFLWDEDGVHLSEEATDETVYRVTKLTVSIVSETFTKERPVHQLYNYTTAVRYLRFQGYTRKSGEKCVIISDDLVFHLSGLRDSLLIRRLQMNILTHVTMEDTRIYDGVSQYCKYEVNEPLILNIPPDIVRVSDEERGTFLEELNQTGECVQYRGGSQGSVLHVNWLRRNWRHDIVRSCIGLHPHNDIYIINNTAYRKHRELIPRFLFDNFLRENSYSEFYDEIDSSLSRRTRTQISSWQK